MWGCFNPFISWSLIRRSPYVPFPRVYSTPPPNLCKRITQTLHFCFFFVFFFVCLLIFLFDIFPKHTSWFGDIFLKHTSLKVTSKDAKTSPYLFVVVSCWLSRNTVFRHNFFFNLFIVFLLSVRVPSTVFFLIDTPTRVVRFKNWPTTRILGQNLAVYVTMIKKQAEGFTSPNVFKFFAIVKLKTLKDVLNCTI